MVPMIKNEDSSAEKECIFQAAEEPCDASYKKYFIIKRTVLCQTNEDFMLTNDVIILKRSACVDLSDHGSRLCMDGVFFNAFSNVFFECVLRAFYRHFSGICQAFFRHFVLKLMDWIGSGADLEEVQCKKKNGE